MLEVTQHNWETKGEFTANFDGQKAGLMTYSWAGNDKIIIDHTEVEQAYNGKGVGKAMVYKAVEFARDNNLKIIPLCPFAKATFQKNEEIRDVL
ncbi:GNAT family N-acetyltransferase [Epilithonimonas sp.]|uniref:GNAT family N-acetyltransferase n=1 Tax=Epilithonimonas sp. TaxID=2894511 RepID=UPI00289FB7DD|nr:GNAT family N-acetyltransferase [Epilithonimonas sp.]